MSALRNQTRHLQNQHILYSSPQWEGEFWQCVGRSLLHWRSLIFGQCWQPWTECWPSPSLCVTSSWRAAANHVRHHRHFLHFPYSHHSPRWSQGASAFSPCLTVTCASCRLCPLHQQPVPALRSTLLLIVMTLLPIYM